MSTAKERQLGIGRAAADLHRAVEAYARALHEYVDMAAGIVAESPGAAQAAADPRLEEADGQVALAGGRLDDAFRERLGVGAPIGMAWELGGADIDASDEGPEWEDFFLHLVVQTPPGTSPESLDQVLEHVDEAGGQLVRRLTDAGYVVSSFDTSRGMEPYDDEDDE